MEPGGKFVAVIMPRGCLWERFYFNLKRKPAQAYRRNTNGPVTVVVKDQPVKTWYYNPDEIAALCSPYFRVCRKKAIGFFLPPSYLDPFFEHRPALLNLLNRLENTLGGPSSASDHFLIELERT